MKYLDVNWKLTIDKDTLHYMDTASDEVVEEIMETIAQAVADDCISGLFTIEIDKE
jgi:hypothetical protein